MVELRDVVLVITLIIAISGAIMGGIALCGRKKEDFDYLSVAGSPSDSDSDLETRDLAEDTEAIVNNYLKNVWGMTIEDGTVNFGGGIFVADAAVIHNKNNKSPGLKINGDASVTGNIAGKEIKASSTLAGNTIYYGEGGVSPTRDEDICKAGYLCSLPSKFSDNT